MSKTNWDKRFIDLARHFASWSKDRSTGVGAVIVDDEKRILEGYRRSLHSKKSEWRLHFSENVSQAMDLLEKYEIDIVGGGDSSKLTDLIDKLDLGGVVSIIGSLSHPVGINKWLDSIDIYVQPSKQEGLPRAVIEAMSRGCTCIGSTAGGIPELLESDFIHQQEDVNAFASLIIKATKKESLIKQCKRNFSESKKYTSTTLDRKRNEFYRKSFYGDPE